jgi:hypothetical protein
VQSQGLFFSGQEQVLDVGFKHVSLFVRETVIAPKLWVGMNVFKRFPPPDKER